ncbi:MAG: hypothetical protein IKT52_13560 [Oscillospiraceae bacterium]|nr:hypothetical protein [Oscillospiraceae bacterium]
MPIVAIENPEIMTVSFRQTRNDTDYGSCLWARFNFDLKNYHLSIESDCGSYAYGWTPTPDHETFITLCSRFDSGYLLDKLSNRSIVDGDATYKCLIEWLKDYDGYGYKRLSCHDMQHIEEACHANRNDHAVLRAIEEALEDTDFDGSVSDYDIACCIELTYPAGAKRIVQIYKDHIQPELRKLSGYKVKEESE